MAPFDGRVAHPDYAANIARWNVEWDFFRGGRHVIAPASSPGRVYFWGSDPRAESPESSGAEPVRRRSSYDPVVATSYLFSHPRESRENYDDRVRRSCHLPMYRHTVETVASAVLRIPPNRGVEDTSTVGEPWKSYWEDVDRQGNGIDAIINEALRMALGVGGRVHAVTTRPLLPSSAQSRYEQQVYGDRPYSYLVSARDLLDWAMDDLGFVWVVIREPAPDRRAPGTKPDGERSERRRVIGRGWWQLYEGRDATWTEIGSGTVGHDVVTVATLWGSTGYDACASMAADSVIAPMLDIDRSVFNLMSLLDDQLAAQGFSQLWVPVESGADLPSLDIGTSVANAYDAEHGTPLMLSPSADVITALAGVINGRIAQGRQSLSISRGRAEFSKEERSGDAMQIEATERDNLAAALALNVQEFDRQMHWHVALWEGLDDYPRAQYSKNVTPRDVGKLIDDVVKISSVQQLEPKIVRELLRPLVAQVLAQMAVPEDRVQDVTKMIDAMVNMPAMAPSAAMPPTGQPKPTNGAPRAGA